MRSWDTLTETGKIRRLRALATTALAEFPIEPLRLRLNALARDTDLDVARFVRARDGRRYVHAPGSDVPGERRCVLFEWVPGRILGDGPTEI